MHTITPIFTSRVFVPQQRLLQLTKSLNHARQLLITTRPAGTGK